MPLPQRNLNKDHAMSTELARTPPYLYRSEAFVEDLEVAPQPWVVKALSAPLSAPRMAAWALAVPGTVALLASAVVLATMPA